MSFPFDHIIAVQGIGAETHDRTTAVEMVNQYCAYLFQGVVCTKIAFSQRKSIPAPLVYGNVPNKSPLGVLPCRRSRPLHSATFQGILYTYSCNFTPTQHSKGCGSMATLLVIMIYVGQVNRLKEDAFQLIV